MFTLVIRRYDMPTIRLIGDEDSVSSAFMIYLEAGYNEDNITVEVQGTEWPAYEFFRALRSVKGK